VNTLPNIVLVHGAWADGSSWSAVIERLQADGLTVIADASRSDQTLVRSLGADYVLDRGDTFAEHVRSIASEGVPGRWCDPPEHEEALSGLIRNSERLPRSSR
jgi:NADPH:quinone reductase-like Zn-dependent oxidoreductase